jgi:pyruvate kinase
MERRAKIVATLGPATADEGAIRALLAAGVDVVRLNLSHGTHDWHRERIRLVRAAADAARRHVPVMLDLMGPRFRLAPDIEPRRLEEGETVLFGAPGAGVDLPVDDPDLLAQLQPGERVLIDQGLVELMVEERRGERVAARVVAGGEVASRKGINLPDSDFAFHVTDKDRADVAFAAAERVDYLAASYVGRAADLEALRRVVAEAGAAIPLIAKLERGRAAEHLDEIVAAADAVMVARGDLGVEVPIDRVPVLQKQIVAAGLRLGRPVIVATQMLESMMEQPLPTRAEASDVANAVFDGADALMLSGETAAGHHPTAAVETMARIIAAAEDYLLSAHAGPVDLQRSGAAGVHAPGVLGRLDGDVASEVPDTVSAAAVYAARELGAHRLVAFSQSGATGRLVARYRPSTPIVVFTNDRAVARRLQLVWGVKPHLLGDELEHHDEVVEVVDRELLAQGLAERGQLIVVLMGDPIRERRQTNLMRVHRVRTVEDWERAREESRGKAWGGRREEGG